MLLAHTHEIQKDGTGEAICRAAMEVQRSDLWTWCGGERRGQNEQREYRGNICITICKIDGQWGFAV